MIVLPPDEAVITSQLHFRLTYCLLCVWLDAEPHRRRAAAVPQLHLRLTYSLLLLLPMCGLMPSRTAAVPLPYRSSTNG